MFCISALLICVSLIPVLAFNTKSPIISAHFNIQTLDRNLIRKSQWSMNIIEDAFKFFSNLKKEASAKHILIKGPEANQKLIRLKEEIESADDLSLAFSEIASKVSECPSATRGGKLGTFKPGMMVKEIDQLCFEGDIGRVYGPIETQFGSHLILITRRYEGDNTQQL